MSDLQRSVPQIQRLFNGKVVITIQVNKGSCASPFWAIFRSIFLMSMHIQVYQAKKSAVVYFRFQFQSILGTQTNHCNWVLVPLMDEVVQCSILTCISFQSAFTSTNMKVDKRKFFPKEKAPQLQLKRPFLKACFPHGAVTKKVKKRKTFFERSL